MPLVPSPVCSIFAPLDAGMHAYKMAISTASAHFWQVENIKVARDLAPSLLVVPGLFCNAPADINTPLYVVPFTTPSKIFLPTPFVVSVTSYLFCLFTVEEMRDYAPSPGATFGVGVTAFVLGLIDAVLVLVFFRHAGDGPLFPCISSVIATHQQGYPATAGGQKSQQHQGPVVAGQHIVSAAPPPAFDLQAGGSTGLAPTLEPAVQGLPPPYTESPRPGNA